MLRKGSLSPGKGEGKTGGGVSPPLLCALARWAWYLLLRLAFLDTNLAWDLLGRRLDAGRKASRQRSEPRSFVQALVPFPKRFLCPSPSFLLSRPIQELLSLCSSASSLALPGNPRFFVPLLSPSFLLQDIGERRGVSGRGPSTPGPWPEVRTRSRRSRTCGVRAQAPRAAAAQWAPLFLPRLSRAGPRAPPQ